MSAAAAGRPLIGVALAVFSVALFAAGDTLTKVLTARHPVELVAAVRFAVSLVRLGALIAPQPRLRREGTWRPRRWRPALRGAVVAGADALLMVVLGVLFTGGHFLFGAAYREAPPALVAPVNYLHFVFAALMGWGFFDLVPDAVTIAGMAVIVGAGIGIALTARRG